jgi:hypothetical protein
MTRLMQWGLFYCSTVNLLTLTLERYLAIVHPFNYSRYVTKTRVRVAMVVVWFAGIGFACSLSIPTSAVVAGNLCSTYYIFPSEAVRKFFGVIVAVTILLIPVSIIVYAYTKILIFLRKHERNMNNFSVKERDEKAKRARNNILKNLFIVSVCFILCWIPNTVYFVYFFMGMQLSFTSPLYHMTNMAVNINCCINPIIYSIQFEQFQSGLKTLFCQCYVSYRADNQAVEMDAIPSETHCNISIQTIEITQAV